MAVYGSPEYALIWKGWDMKSGPPICALRASGRPISVNVSTGWPLDVWPKTPMASDGDGGIMEIRPGTTGKYKLRDFAQLAGWNTAMANDAIRRGQVEPGTKTLNNTAMLAGWATANWHDGRRPGADLKSTQGGNLSRDAVVLMGWNTARATDGSNGGPNQANGALSADASRTLGRILELYFVPTGRRVVLAPEFSLWLMGFPEAWALMAPGAKDWREAQAALELEFSKALETR